MNSERESNAHRKHLLFPLRTVKNFRLMGTNIPLYSYSTLIQSNQPAITMKLNIFAAFQLTKVDENYEIFYSDDDLKE